MRSGTRAAPTAIALLLFAFAHPAAAGPNDLRLLNLCGEGEMRADGNSECKWIQRDSAGLVTGIVPDAQAFERFRSLMSQLGAVMAPQIVTPASTLGFSGFQLSGELSTTQIASGADYWDGVESVSPNNRNFNRPSGSLTTVGVFARKGIWLPVPSMEAGAGFLHLLDSQLIAYQGYLKFAIHEGFQDWPIPSVAARVGISHVTGTTDIRMDIISVDLILSKRFGVAGTLSLEPFIGGSQLYIKAKSGRFDVTPGCDGFAPTFDSNPMVSNACTLNQVGTQNDLRANYSFPDQDTIRRNQAFAGVKIHFAAVHLTAQYGRVFAQHSRDSSPDGLGARDDSPDQDRFSMSAGFDY